MNFENSVSTDNGNLDFGSSAPCQKGWISKKLVPAVQKVGVAAGKVGVVAGKVATIAALL
jgi:hypothetical protein